MWKKYLAATITDLYSCDGIYTTGLVYQKGLINFVNTRLINTKINMNKYIFQL